MAECSLSVIQHQRNIVLVGKTGGGKSTVANSIAGRKLFPVSSSTKSVPGKIRSETVKISEGDTEYSVKIIDTMGLFSTEAISNKDIIRTLKEHFQTRVSEGVHLVLFVFKEGRFTKEDKETFDLIMKKFSSEISCISALVVTKCELMNEQAREETIDDFKTNPVTGPIADFVQKGIFTVGFPDMDKIMEEDKPRLQERIEKDRGKLLLLVRTCEDEPQLAKELFKDPFWEKCHIL